MLAKKFYAQRNNNMKKKSSQVSANSASYLRQKRLCCDSIVKKMPVRGASESTEYIRSKTVKCAVDNGFYKKDTTPPCKSHTHCKKAFRTVTKDAPVAESAKEHIEKVKALVNCNDADYRGLVPIDNNC